MEFCFIFFKTFFLRAIVQSDSLQDNEQVGRPVNMCIKGRSAQYTVTCKWIGFFTLDIALLIAWQYLKNCYKLANFSVAVALMGYWKLGIRSCRDNFYTQVLITIYWLGKAANSCTSYSGPTLNLKEFEGLLAQIQKVVHFNFSVIMCVYVCMYAPFRLWSYCKTLLSIMFRVTWFT